jgi:hypothetical protein
MEGRMNGRVCVLAIAMALFTGAAQAAPYVNAAKNFTLELPPGWYMAAEYPMTVDFGVKGEEGIVGEVDILDHATKLDDKDVLDIEFESVRVTKSNMTTQAGMPARRIEGKGRSDIGKDVSFFLIVIKPPTGTLIRLLIFAPADELKSQRAAIDSVLASFMLLHQ